MTQDVRPLYIRSEWKKNCVFQPLNEAELFQLIEQKMSLAKDEKPVLLLDLDSTLYEVAPRTHAIILDWTKTAHPFSKEIVQKLSQIEHTRVGYSLRDTFENMGLDLNQPDVIKAWEDLKTFWTARFFTNEYLSYDKPYPGAVHFAQKAHDLGVFLVYLTGREETPMIAGTIKNLERDGFPWNTGRTSLLMRPSHIASDLEHKTLAIEKVKQTGTLVASFENEPQNLVALFKAFPEGLHVLMDTVSSDHPAEAVEGLYLIKGFTHYHKIS